MGSYAYCSHKDCGRPLSKPDAQEVIYDTWRCTAGHYNYNHTYTKDDLILDMAERLEALEERLKLI
jgi:hypothetical protein